MCQHCLSATPKINKITDDLNIILNQYNLLEFDEGRTKYNINSTPTLVSYKDGKEVDRIIGDQKESKIEDFIKSEVETNY